MSYKLLAIGMSMSPFIELASQLENHFECLFLKNINSLKDVVQSWQPELVLLSDKTEFEEGIIFVRESPLYPKAILPGIVVVASQYSLRDENESFKRGCDLYLLAHTPISSIINRLSALANRVHATLLPPNIHYPKIDNVRTLPVGQAESPPDSILYEDLEIFPSQRRVMLNGVTVHLTPLQFDLLHLFVVQVDQMLERDLIARSIWRAKTIHLRTVDAHVAKLKKSLPFLEDRILNIYGKGYRLRAPHKKAS